MTDLDFSIGRPPRLHAVNKVSGMRVACADRFTVETLIPQARSQQPICTIPSLPYTATPFRCSSMPADDLGCHDRLTRRRHLPPRSSHLLRFAELADKQCGAGFSGTADWAGLNENVPPKPSKFVRVSHWKQMGAQMSLRGTSVPLERPAAVTCGRRAEAPPQAEAG